MFPHIICLDLQDLVILAVFRSPAPQSERVWSTEDGPHVGLIYNQPLSPPHASL